MFYRNRHEMMSKNRFKMESQALPYYRRVKDERERERIRKESMTNMDLDPVKIVPNMQIKK